jgi:glutamine amidotransferase
LEVAIVKYNAGNTQSLIFALERLGIDPVLTDDPEKLFSAEKVIFPGQGEASSAMRYLKEKKLDQVLTSLKQPFLGVCLGMQLMCTSSEENDTECLNIIPGVVTKFNYGLKVPHMGWNTIESLSSPLFKNIEEGAYL